MDREPLLLLHGVTMSAMAWDDVIPLLADDFEPLVPTIPGHRGGPRLEGAVTIERLVDHTEQLLDERGLNAVHVAGNSLGGWMGVELARRGRARSVCALSPAGFWTAGAADNTAATGRLRRSILLARAGHRIAALPLHVPLVRRLVFDDVAVHGDRLTAAQALGAVRDVAACTAADDILDSRESIAPLPEPPCPITLAWGQRDRIFPPSVNGAVARQRIPRARHLELPGASHVPMIDDPALCAATIRTAVALERSGTGD
ncbi:alpha/beta hydrolase [Nocardia sp. 2]|uniref:Alpha/beta hydrolase n=1 Tax=Nocardia acididurans TaxID=2802282 RepID=A0ABS1LZ77_9NOCA|nr:alpha/beta hydrolase [Nocardia acididurans]MBL1073723.1 alpha/beta hydrolase [Nocardia acididurans]